MNITYRRNISQSLLVAEGEPCDEYGVFALHMLLHNSLDGFLKPEIEEVNGTQRLLYDISTQYSMAGMFEMKKMNLEDLKQFLSALEAGADVIEGYLLDAGFLLLDPEYIYLPIDASSYRFCMCPYQQEEDDRKGRHALADLLISCIDYSDRELVKLAYAVNMAINSDNFSVKNIYANILGDSANGEEPQLYRSFSDSLNEDLFSVSFPDQRDTMAEANPYVRVADESSRKPSGILSKVKAHVNEWGLFS